MSGNIITVKFKRVLLKLSGEQFGGDSGVGIDSTFINNLADEIKELVDETGVELVLVVGGGNFVRGKDLKVTGVEEETAHYMGIISTVINGLAFRDVLRSASQAAYAQSSISIPKIADDFEPKKALEHLANGEVLLILGGTGTPFVTTDTGAVKLATELDCEVVLKATKVDGIYDSDPTKNRQAKKFKSLTHRQASDHKDINVMDNEAHEHAHKHGLPVIVFNLNQRGNIKKVVQGEKIGTYVTS